MDKVFAQLTGLGARRALKSLMQSPFTMHEGMVELIRAEARGPAGKRARIMAKMNSLLEEQIIEELYKASQAGVKIDLIVRGGAARACRACPRTSGCAPSSGASWSIRVFSISTPTATRPSTCPRRTGWTAIFPPRRDRLPDLRQDAQEARHRRSLHLRAARQPVVLAATARRRLRPGEKPRKALQRAPVPDAEAGRVALRPGHVDLSFVSPQPGNAVRGTASPSQAARIRLRRSATGAPGKRAALRGPNVTVTSL